MKRRNFLLSSAALSLSVLGVTSAEAAKKTPQKPAQKSKTPPKRPTPPTKARAKSTPATLADAPSAAPEKNALSLPDEPEARWQAYDIRTSITLKNISGEPRLYLPLALYKDSPWQRSFGHEWQGNYKRAGIYRDPVANIEVFYAEWSGNTASPQIEIRSALATQNRHFDITRRKALLEKPEILRKNLRATRLVLTDGIVRQTAEQAIGRVKDPLAQAKALYDWVVEHTRYDPLAKAFGEADIGSLLESGALNGRSPMISLLFVGLCRSMGIPARPVFGMRIDRSQIFSCLGTTSGNLAAFPHCRAEFYSHGYGWIPVDPSDVRKSMLEENLSSQDSKLIVLKKLLFGFWEMNWMAFNAAEDVDFQELGRNFALPQENAAQKESLPYFIYPTVETAQGRFSSKSGELNHFNQSNEFIGYEVTASRRETL